MKHIYIPRIKFWIEKKPIYNKIEKHLIKCLDSELFLVNGVNTTRIARLIYFHPNHQDFIMNYIDEALKWETDKAIIVGDIYADLREQENKNPHKIRLEQ